MSAANGGKISFEGTVPPDDDKEFTPALEAVVTSNWIEAIGGKALLNHIFVVYSKDLMTESLADIRLRIIDNLDNLRSSAA